MSDELTERIEEVAQQPAAATAPGRSAEQHKLPDLIAAQEHVANQQMAGRRKLPIRLFGITPGGTP